MGISQLQVSPWAFVFHWSIMESPLGARQPVLGVSCLVEWLLPLPHLPLPSISLILFQSTPVFYAT